jgi:transposase-like protein
MGLKGEPYQMAAKKRTYTPEFKQQAVKLVLSGKKSRAQIAREIGVRADLLFRWQKDFAPQSTIEAESMKTTSTERRVRELERELATVKEERDILKKATALFAKG